MNLTSDDEQNWAFLRQLSLQPGGFGEDRIRIWPALLGAQPLSDPPPYSEEDNEYGSPMEQGASELVTDPHADERQIKLDTDRSFVLYPGESGTTLARDSLQNDLLGLLVSLFRKRRSLHYFQGFHDIITVLFLTLPRPLHLVCAEKMALHRVRDAMGVGLEPVLGLLRVLRNLLRLADPAYAKLLENTSPLPYHALSHLLTLFSHDVPTLPLIQHVWDFLLSREPIAVVWLAAALILHRKPSVYLLAEQDEEGMIHSLLGGLPQLVDTNLEYYINDTFAEMQPATERDVIGENSVTTPHSNGGERVELRKKPDPNVNRRMPEFPGTGEQADSFRDHFTGGLERNDIQIDMAQNSDTPGAGSSSTSAKHRPPLEVVSKDCGSPLELAMSIPLPQSRSASPVSSPDPSSPAQLTMSLSRGGSHVDQRSPSPSASDQVLPRSPSSSDVTRPPMQSTTVTYASTTHFSEPSTSKPRIKSVPLSLTSLLRQADDLLTTYPTSHPLLRVDEIMGPDSAVRTWRPLPLGAQNVPEKRPYNETDDYVENLVNSPHIVVPSPPPSPSLGHRPLGKKTRLSPRMSRKSLLDPRSVRWRLGALTPAERRVLFMGALLVVGAAVALKSSKVAYMESIVKSSGGEGLKRLWNGKWRLMSSVIAAWGRGLP